MTGKLVVFEGIDKSGKATQSVLLARWLKSQGFKVQLYSFPKYETSSGQDIRKWLDGQKQLDQVHLNALYTLNRLEQRKLMYKDLEECDFVIVDRYYYSNWVYGHFQEEVNKVWLNVLDDPMPKADMVVLIDIPGKESRKRKRTAVDDRHETNVDFLEKCRMKYVELANAHHNWMQIDGTDDKEKIAWRIRSHSLFHRNVVDVSL